MTHHIANIARFNAAKQVSGKLNKKENSQREIADNPTNHDGKTAHDCTCSITARPHDIHVCE